MNLRERMIFACVFKHAGKKKLRARRRKDNRTATTRRRAVRSREFSHTTCNHNAIRYHVTFVEAAVRFYQSVSARRLWTKKSLSYSMLIGRRYLIYSDNELSWN